jgi:DNA-binding IclR family transcriptional regulator
MRKREPTGILEREQIMAELSHALNSHSGSLSELAKTIGLSPSTVYNVRNERPQ